MKFFEHELQNIKKLDHKNIVKIARCGTDGRLSKSCGTELCELAYALLEHQSGGLLIDVHQMLCGGDEHGGFDEDVSIFFMGQLLDALQYAHDKGIAHGDLKFENILVDGNLNLKVADFGLASLREI